MKQVRVHWKYCLHIVYISILLNTAIPSISADGFSIFNCRRFINSKNSRTLILTFENLFSIYIQIQTNFFFIRADTEFSFIWMYKYEVILEYFYNFIILYYSYFITFSMIILLHKNLSNTICLPILWAFEYYQISILKKQPINVRKIC